MVVEPEYVSPDEAAVAFEQLQPVDMVRLGNIARNRLRGLNTDWEDLLQEALTRILEGTRKWPRHVSIIAFLAEVMRSLASEQWQRQSRSKAKENPSSINPGPENASEAKAELNNIESFFNDDDEVLAVIMARAEGCSPEEIQNMFKLTSTQYDSTLKRIRRKLDHYKKKGAEQ